MANKEMTKAEMIHHMKDIYWRAFIETQRLYDERSALTVTHNKDKMFKMSRGNRQRLFREYDREKMRLSHRIDAMQSKKRTCYDLIVKMGIAPMNFVSSGIPATYTDRSV